MHGVTLYLERRGAQFERSLGSRCSLGTPILVGSSITLHGVSSLFGARSLGSKEARNRAPDLVSGRGCPGASGRSPFRHCADRCSASHVLVLIV